MGKQIRREEDRGATASEFIAAIEHLLTEILLRLPVKSLLRFKSVSKYWLSLISSPQFCVLKSKRCSKHMRAILLRDLYSFNPRFNFIALEPGQTAPFERLNFVDDERGGLDAIQCCNGLLLCSGSRFGDPVTCSSYNRKAELKYYVYNPTTRQHTTVPVNRILDSGKVSRPYIVHLAFDPRISPHFKILCGYMTETRGLDPQYHYKIGIYSSDTGLMRQIDDHFHTNVDLLNTWSRHWNGAIHFIVKDHDSLYFKFDAECFRILPMPPMPDITEGVEIEFGEEFGRYVRYFGESDDHLHLIQTNINLTAQFDVYELDKEYSGWFVRFRVDLQPVFRSFPEGLSSYLHPLHICYYTFGILSVVERADDEMPYLVLSVRGKAIQFNLKDGSFTKMCDFPAMVPFNGFFPRLPMNDWHDSIQLAESLHPL